MTAAEKFEAISLKAARLHELPDSQPTHSEVSPLKILIPYLQLIPSAPPVSLNNTGPGCSFVPEAIHMRLHLGVELLWAPAVAVVLHIILISVILISVCCFCRSQCLKQGAGWVTVCQSKVCIV